MNSHQRMQILLFACLTTPKHKENSMFQYFYCATCWVLWCATRCTVFCSVLNVVVQFYLRARQNEFHVVTNCKYIVKYILWKYVHFQIFTFFLLVHSLVFICCHVYSKINEMLIKIRGIWKCRSSHWRCSVCDLRNNAKFTEKNLCQRLFFNKLYWKVNFIEKEALAQVFSCELCEILKNTFLTEHLWATTSENGTQDFCKKGRVI